MPGYDGIKTVREGDMKDGMICSHCDKPLREPVQTEDGMRLCKSCAQQITKKPHNRCTSCGAEVNWEKCYPDKAVQRDILRLLVYCLYCGLGCKWEGPLGQLDEHCNNCIFKGVACPNKGCGDMVTEREIEEHKLSCQWRLVCCEECSESMEQQRLETHNGVCPEGVVNCQNTGCSTQVKRRQLKEHHMTECLVETCNICQVKVHRSTGEELVGGAHHLTTPTETFRHVQTISLRCNELSNQIEGLRLGHDHMTQDFVSGGESIAQLQSEIKGLKPLPPPPAAAAAVTVAVDKNMQDKIKRLEDKLQIRDSRIDSQTTELNELKRVVERLLSTTERNTKQIRTRSPTTTTSANPTTSMPHDPRFLQLETRVEELTRQSSTTQHHVQELELQLQASLASTHNGSFLWRIPDISRRRRDAIEERITSIYSPPFYTGRNGYKMCIRAYLNGDGSGYNTHLSMFFVIMRGEFDNLLKWPFDHKVSLILVDQDHRRHIVQTFKPTAESNSFQQPQSDMNVASGCPHFVKLSILNDTNYVRDDLLYIKCIIDTTKIFHP